MQIDEFPNEYHVVNKNLNYTRRMHPHLLWK